MSSEFFRLTPIKATQKPHRCECCGTIFPPGSAMLSYAGMYEGDFCHFYYCKLCDDLYHILDWDWSEGIHEAREALANGGVISSIKCPYYEQAATDVKELEPVYYRRSAGEQDIPEFDRFDCENKPEEHCHGYDLDFITGKVNFTCHCFNGEHRTWEADIRETARTYRAEVYARPEE